MKNLNKKIITNIIKIICTCFIFYFLVLFQDVFYNYCNYNAIIYLCNIKITFFALFFVLLFFIMFLAITKKTWKSILIVSILLFILTTANQLKIIYTEEPLAFSDILFLKNSSGLIDIINESFFETIKMYIPKMILYIIIMIACCFVSYCNNLTVEGKKTRIIMFMASASILLLLFIPNQFITNFLLNDIYDIDNRTDYTRITSKKEEFLLNGVITGMYGQFLENKIFEPYNYDNALIEKEVNSTEDIIDDNSFGSPNIIVLFAESFWDINLLEEEIEFDKKITSNFEELKEKGIFFNMIAPSYGGLSANVEFEFLTGANMMYFPEGYIPIMRLYNNDSFYNAPSITRELSNNGYRTKIVNYTPETSFDISNFYEYISIDETEFNTNVDKKYYKGEYVSDEYVVDQIIDEFDNKSEDEKLFYMTLSMQSHMTYLIDKYDEYDINITKSLYNKEMNDTLLSYAQGIYDMDLQLGRLYEYIQGLEEPTMIVFFGDHLPYLKTVNGINLLNHLEYFNTDDNLVNYYRKYNTQALILANFEIEEENIEYLSPDLLGTYIINRMDINISQYYKWLNKYINIIPAANWYTAIDGEGKLYSTKDLKGNLNDAYHIRECVQYKYFIKN